MTYSMTMRVLPVLCTRKDVDKLRYSMDLTISEWVSTVTGELMDQWVKDGVVNDELSTKWRIERDIDEVVQELESDISGEINQLLDMVEVDDEKRED